MPNQHPNLLWVGRKFGVEMEFNKEDRSGAHINGHSINAALTEACGYDVHGRGGAYYSTTRGRSWEVQYDATSGSGGGSGWEVSSPALQMDEDGECT